MDVWNSEDVSRGEVFDVFAGVMKAVANGRRLELLELMAQGEHSVDELSQMTGMAVTTTSAHLQTLKRSGLVLTRRERTSIYYRLAGDDVAALYTAAKQVALSKSPTLRDALQTYMTNPASEGPTIDRDQLTSEMLVVDVRPRHEFEAGHLPGAISIPMDELHARYSEIPEGVEVVLYCRGELCRWSREAAAWLRERGVDATSMQEGIVEWRAEGALVR